MDTNHKNPLILGVLCFQRLHELTIHAFLEVSIVFTKSITTYFKRRDNVERWIWSGAGVSFELLPQLCGQCDCSFMGRSFLSTFGSGDVYQCKSVFYTMAAYTNVDVSQQYLYLFSLISLIYRYLQVTVSPTFRNHCRNRQSP